MTTVFADDETVFVYVKDQRVCPQCRFRHGGAHEICDVCARGLPGHNAPLSNVLCVLEPSRVLENLCETPAPPMLHNATMDSGEPRRSPSTASSPRGCSICTSPDRAHLDAGLREEAESQSALAQRFRVSPNALSRHRCTCLSLPPRTRHEAAQIGRRVTSARAIAHCKVCAHPALEDVNCALRAGESIEKIRRRYLASSLPLGEKAIVAHRKKCLFLQGRVLPTKEHAGAPVNQDSVPAATHDTAAPPSFSLARFSGHVAEELARLVAHKDALHVRIAALQNEYGVTEQAYVALRIFQDLLKKEERDGSTF